MVVHRHISEPSLTRARHVVTQRNDESRYGQSELVDQLLSGRRGGFFIECGAGDGETSSNSLFFELERNWTGLLIEPNPDFYRTLLQRNRRAYVLGACLSPERRPTTAHLLMAQFRGGIVDKMHPSHLAALDSTRTPRANVNCFPLNSVTAALGVTHVDYMSVDVEGPELEILRTVDWTRLRVDVVAVEYRIHGPQEIDRPATLKKLQDLRQFFRDTGLYREVAVLPPGDESVGMDIVYIRI